MKIQSSLRQKITFGYYGYYAMAALIIGLSLFTFMELRLIEGKIHSGSRISEFFDVTLEIRRFEKNYFLYRQMPDYWENIGYIEKAQSLLDKHGNDFEALTTHKNITNLNSNLFNYRRLLDQYSQHALLSPPQLELLEARIRNTGRAITIEGEHIANSERLMLQKSLDKARTFFFGYIALIALVMIAIGMTLSKMVVRPLRHMESCINGLTGGRLEKLKIDSNEHEIISITHAFNHMIEELEKRQQCITRSEKLASMGTLLSGVAHELNNPISNISSSCQILQEELGHADIVFQKEMLEQIDNQTDRARIIVRSLLDFARDREFKQSDIALDQLIAETIRFSKGMIPPNVTLTCDLPENLMITADSQRLQQALLNLLQNCLDALDGQGEIHIKAVKRLINVNDKDAIAFHGRCEAHIEVIDIEIQDNGAGIADDVLPRIFDPFFTTKDVGQGSGLGLSIVHDIIEQHHGCIAVSSASGCGTTFSIRLPAQIPSLQPI